MFSAPADHLSDSQIIDKFSSLYFEEKVNLKSSENKIEQNLTIELSDSIITTSSTTSTMTTPTLTPTTLATIKPPTVRMTDLFRSILRKYSNKIYMIFTYNIFQI